MELPKLIAFYLPQYHPIPENDEWWGKGFTEWTNVAKAAPQFVGHSQPLLPADLGFYDLRLPEVRREQAELAQQYGIHGFCYYYYWFNGRRILEKPLDAILQSGEPDFPFCICWANENWTRRWDGLEKEILLEQKHIIDEDNRFIFDVIPILQDPRYIRVDGKPMLLVYRPELLEDPAETAKFWRKACVEAGLPGLHLCCVEFRVTDPSAIGFDALIEFPPHRFPQKNITDRVVKLNPDFSGIVLDYYWGVQAAIQRELPSFRLYRGLVPSWDNTARRGGQATVLQYATPEIYRQWLRHLIAAAVQACQQTAEPTITADAGFVFVNAWNEWAEGAFLEPSQGSGRAWLEATRQAQNFSAYSTADIDEAAHQAYLRAIAATRPAHQSSRWANAISKLKSLSGRSATLKPKLHKVKESLKHRGPIKTSALIFDRLKHKLTAPDNRPSLQVLWSHPPRLNGKPEGQRRPQARTILFVSHDAALAGAQLAMLENLKYFSQFPELDCYLLLCQGGQLEPTFKKFAKTSNLAALMGAGLSRQAAIDRVIQDIRAKAPMMALCNTVVTADVVAACHRAQIPVMACIYELPASIETYVGKQPFLNIVELARRVIVASDYVQKALVDFYGIEPAQLIPIHAGIRQQRNIYSNKADARQAVLKEFNLPEHTCLVLGCGSIHPRKGTDLFVQVAKKVLQQPQTEHVRFIWIGADQQGPLMRRWCEHDLRIAGLTDKVLFIGQRPEEKLDPYFAAADVFLLSSREDPFPLVNLTAMSHGLPVIAFSDAGGAQEVLSPDAGMVVPYIDADAMAEALTHLISSPDLRSKVGRAAIKKCKTQYQWARYIRDLVAIMNADFDCGITTVAKPL